MSILLTWLYGFVTICLGTFMALGARYGEFGKSRNIGEGFDNLERTLCWLGIGLIWPLAIPCVVAVQLGRWFRLRAKIKATRYVEENTPPEAGTPPSIPAARTVRRSD